MNKSLKRALARAKEYAYEAASGMINPEAREETYLQILAHVEHGIRLMCEEANMNESETMKYLISTRQ